MISIDTRTVAQSSLGLTRRRFLCSASLSLTALAGCKSREPEATPSVSPSTRSSVPLRLLLVGDEPSSQAIERGWNALDSTPLTITRIDLNRAATADLGKEMLAKSLKHDVILFPHLLIGDLFTAEQLVPLEVRSLPSFESGDAQIPSSIRNGLSQFASQSLVIPLGGLVPAVFSVDLIDKLNDWKEYDSLVESWNGEAGEPIGEGWAGTMFLWRAITTCRNEWLFDRRTMQPRIDNPSYVSVLDQMRQTVDRYVAKVQSPQEIWSGLQAGKLRGGIAFPVNRDVFPDVQLTSMPRNDEVEHCLFDPFTPVAGITTACRQTSQAKRFIAWLLMPETTGSVQTVFIGTKQTVFQVQATENSGGSKTPYDSWLDNHWRTPIVSPTLALLNGCQYYAILDQAIRECLGGSKSSTEVLGQVANQWHQLTQKIGVDRQVRVWQQCHGRSG